MNRRPADGHDPSAGMRRLLGWVLGLGIVGVAAELALLEHFEDWKQWTPFVVLGTGLLTLAWSHVRRSATAIRVHMGVMVVFVLSGGVGVWLHYRGNAEFELEMVPSMSGFELIKESMMGAFPALAPGTMTLLGLVGMVAVHAHPTLRAEGNRTLNSTDTVDGS